MFINYFKKTPVIADCTNKINKSCVRTELIQEPQVAKTLDQQQEAVPLNLAIGDKRDKNDTK